MSTTFKQFPRKVTKAQLQLFQQETASLNKHCRNLIGHVLVNQKRRYTTRGYDGWPGVPVPRVSAIDPLFGGDLGRGQGYTWDSVKHLLQRDYYSIEESKCYCYTLPHEFVEKFIAAAEDTLLDVNKIKNERFYSWDPEAETFTVFRENKMVRNPSNRPTTPVNLRAACDFLRNEKEKIRLATQHRDSSGLPERERTQNKLDKLQRRYIHNLYCFQTIVQNLTTANWAEGTAEYLQQTFQPQPGLRFYEKGGGLQGASTQLKEALQKNTGAINVDAKSCHLAITTHEMKAAGIDSPLEEMLKDGYKIDLVKLGYPAEYVHYLSEKTIKIAVLATINGATLTTNLKETRKTLPKLIKEEPQLKDYPTPILQHHLEILVKYLTPLHKAVKEWEQTLPDNPTMPRITAFLQKKEVELLTPLKEIACNDQHDGAIIRKEDYYKVENIDTGYLKIAPKNLAKQSAEYPDIEIANMERRAHQALEEHREGNKDLIVKYRYKNGSWRWEEEGLQEAKSRGVTIPNPPIFGEVADYKWDDKATIWRDVTAEEAKKQAWKAQRKQDSPPLSTDNYESSAVEDTTKSVQNCG